MATEQNEEEVEEYTHSLTEKKELDDLFSLRYEISLVSCWNLSRYQIIG